MIIGIGIDLMEVERMKKAIERHKDTFKQCVFSDEEQKYCEKDVHLFQHYAARFAAKEAFTKAIGTGQQQGVVLRNIVVKNGGNGNPEIYLEGRAKEVYEQIGGKKIHLNLSHTEQYAVAVVVIEGCK